MITHASDLLDRALPSIGTREGAAPGTVEAAETFFDDGTLQIGLWECTPGEFPTAKVGTNESAQILSGSATLRRDDGTETLVHPGDTVVTPDGWRGTWTVHQTMRKIYTVWSTPAGSPASARG
jgi:uncharacterized cupin superfamily protein